jgi:hypothetical protein
MPSSALNELTLVARKNFRRSIRLCSVDFIDPLRRLWLILDRSSRPGERLLLVYGITYASPWQGAIFLFWERAKDDGFAAVSCGH